MVMVINHSIIISNVDIVIPRRFAPRA